MSQPACDGENVYITYPAQDRYHHLAALKLENGETVWDVQIAGDLTSAPVIYKNSVYITTLDGTIYRYDKKSGKLIWSFKKNATCAPYVYKDSIFISLREEKGKQPYEGIATLEVINGKQQQKELWSKCKADYSVYGRKRAKIDIRKVIDAEVGIYPHPCHCKT